MKALRSAAAGGRVCCFLIKSATYRKSFEKIVLILFARHPTALLQTTGHHMMEKSRWAGIHVLSFAQGIQLSTLLAYPKGLQVVRAQAQLFDYRRNNVGTSPPLGQAVPGYFELQCTLS